MEEARIEKAVALFKEGFNCSQSVVAAFADKYGFTQEQALKMSASFGGGIGRMRETCGAACGSMVARASPMPRSLRNSRHWNTWSKWVWQSKLMVLLLKNTVP